MASPRSRRRRAKRARGPTLLQDEKAEFANRNHLISNHDTNSHNSSIKRDDEDIFSREGKEEEKGENVGAPPFKLCKNASEAPLSLGIVSASSVSLRPSPPRAYEASEESGNESVSSSTSSTSSLSECRSVDLVAWELRKVFSKVRGVWDRVGIPVEEHIRRWQNFLDTTIFPSIATYLAMTEAEERDYMIENERLARQLLELCHRLQEKPRDAQLSELLRISNFKPLLEEQNEGACYSTQKVDDAIFPWGGEANKNPSKAEESLKVTARESSGDCEGFFNRILEPQRHVGIRQMLREELERLRHLEESRLSFLRLFHQLRRLLSMPLQQQAILWDEYRQRYQDHAQRALHPPPLSSSSVVHRLIEADELSYAEMQSCRSTDGFTTSSQKGEAEEKLSGVAKKSEKTSSGASEIANSCKANGDEELRLLMTASFVQEPMLLDSRATSTWLRPSTVVVSSVQPPPLPPLPSPVENGARENRASIHEDRISPDEIVEHPVSNTDRVGQRSPPVAPVESLVPLSSVGGEKEDRERAMAGLSDSICENGEDLSEARITHDADELLEAITTQNNAIRCQVKSELMMLRKLQTMLMKNDNNPPMVEAIDNDAEKNEENKKSDEVARSVAVELDSVDKIEAQEELANLEERFRALEMSYEASLPHDSGANMANSSAARVDLLPSPAGWLLMKIQRVMRAPSYARICLDVRKSSERFKRRVWDHCARGVDAARTGLREARRQYHALSGGSYETPSESDDGEGKKVDEEEGEEGPEGLSSRTPEEGGGVESSAGSLRGFYARLVAAQRRIDRMRSEQRVLFERIGILEEVQRLLESRTCILKEQQEMQNGRKERLLSKRVNMAKCLLQEEALRKRATRELPQILSRLEEALKRWRDLITKDGEANNSKKPLLCVDGVDVELLLQSEAANKAGSKAAVSARSSGRAWRSPTPLAGASTRSRTISPLPSRPLAMLTTANGSNSMNTNRNRNITSNRSISCRSAPFRVVRHAPPATAALEGAMAPRICPQKGVGRGREASIPSLLPKLARSLSPPPRRGLSPIPVNKYVKTSKAAVEKPTEGPFSSISRLRARPAQVGERNNTNNNATLH